MDGDFPVRYFDITRDYPGDPEGTRGWSMSKFHLQEICELPTGALESLDANWRTVVIFELDPIWRQLNLRLTAAVCFWHQPKYARQMG